MDAPACCQVATPGLLPPRTAQQVPAASHHVHLQRLFGRRPHQAADAFQAQLLVRLIAVAAAEAIELSIHLQDVDGLKQPNLCDARGERLDLDGQHASLVRMCNTGIDAGTPFQDR